MQKIFKKLMFLMATGSLLFAVGGVLAVAHAEERKTNACGCYQKSDGTCVCGRGSKCGCPEECEPMGCEEKRQKEMDKEIQAETKKAQEAERKRNEEAAAKAKAQERTFVDEGEDESGATADEPARSPKDKTKDATKDATKKAKAKK